MALRTIHGALFQGIAGQIPTFNREGHIALAQLSALHAGWPPEWERAHLSVKRPADGEEEAFWVLRALTPAAATQSPVRTISMGPGGDWAFSFSARYSVQGLCRAEVEETALDFLSPSERPAVVARATARTLGASLEAAPAPRRPRV